MKTKFKKSKKGKIVKKFREFVDKNEGFSDIPNTKMKGSGVYALYNNYGLYYVGLTLKNLRSRIKKHTRDHHKNNWDKYSWYQIPRIDYIKDIESTLLHVIFPRGNKTIGRFQKRRPKN